MNFFERQDRARRRSRILAGLFIMAVLAIMAAINLVVLFALALMEGYTEPFLSAGFISRYSGVLFYVTLLTGVVIGIASLYRSIQLRSGGATVAASLGGVRVAPDTEDPLRKRYRNVVEEMAIASGVPVPEIFVLEREHDINAFAAGYSTADAAVAVTRGALEALDREELQGVVAHEFGHILNGDMRLNIRLIGLLFGILVVALIGRRVMFAVRHSGSGRDAAGFMLVGLALMLIGYIGLLFGRMIQASVSRQREFLADASAVQFTRNPDGIGGALKKIGASSAAGLVHVDTEEVGHMLFARGGTRRLLSTHPPLLERIQALDKHFDSAEYDDIRGRMRRHRQERLAEKEGKGTRETPKGGGPGGLPLDAGQIVKGIGQPGMQQILAAALLISGIPQTLERAAHSAEWAPELVCYLLMDPERRIRESQLLMVAEALGHESEAQVRSLLTAVPEAAPESRTALLEMAFPALRQRPGEELASLLTLVERLVHADGKVDIFEYALGKSLSVHIKDVLEPHAVRVTGSRKLQECEPEVYDLMFVFARHGHEQGAERVAALSAGLESLGIAPGTHRGPQSDWPERMDRALEVLDELRGDDKQLLVEAMVTTVAHDGKVVPVEIELMRAVCAALHVPLPTLA